MALDDWMASDYAAYRQRFGFGMQFVVVTPNWICDRRLYPTYLRQLASPPSTRFTACLKWLQQRHFLPPSSEISQVLCRDYTFTGAGAMNMSAKMSAVASKLSGARVLDLTRMTHERCDATGDARHYPSLVPIQAAALGRLLS